MHENAVIHDDTLNPDDPDDHDGPTNLSDPANLPKKNHKKDKNGESKNCKKCLVMLQRAELCPIVQNGAQQNKIVPNRA